MYAIIDVETTGLNAKSEKITEIAIFLHNGQKIVDEFSSLINPEKKIPYRITQMTGITNNMVEEAPRFYEVAKQIVQLTEDTTLVGHNVAFDYHFLRNEFKSLGYDFKREKLCTCRMSRKLIPLKRSYGLSHLCHELNITNPRRHRAAGDATATARLFEILLSINPDIVATPLRGVNSSLEKNKIRHLPKTTGLYFFYNKDGKVIYIGKSINIQERVASHLNNNISKRELELKNSIADVDYITTGSELIALLMESEEIKKHQPLFNQALKHNIFMTGLFSYYDDDGYLRLKIDKINGEEMPLTSFNSMVAAKEYLFHLAEEHRLCQKLCNLYKTSHACFQYHIRQCFGACLKKETPEDYNRRVEQAIEPYLSDTSSYMVFDRGRNEDERSVVLVEEGRFQGYAFIDPSEAICSPDQIKEKIIPCDNNRDAQRIIRNYLKNNRVERMVRL